MSLRDDLASIETTTRSKFQQWVDTLDDEDRAALHEYVHDLNMSNAKISEAVRRNGYNADGTTIARWRRELGITR